MAFQKKTWADRISEFPTRRILTKSDSTTETVTVARSEGTISQEGDAFSAENMNNLEDRIEAEFETIGGQIQDALTVAFTDFFVKATYTYASASVSAGSYKAFSPTGNTIPDGYTPIAIARVNAGGSKHVLRSYQPNGSISIYNTGTSASNTTPEMEVYCAKTSLIKV